MIVRILMDRTPDTDEEFIEFLDRRGYIFLPDAIDLEVILS